MLEAPAEPLSSDQPALDADSQRAIRCGVCGNPVTTPSARTQVEGKHAHRRINPAGQVFRIGCFERAPGALASGKPSDYWSWFDGCCWQVATCRRCNAQLGWRFTANGGSEFFGLILEALVEDRG